MYGLPSLSCIDNFIYIILIAIAPFVSVSPIVWLASARISCASHSLLAPRPSARAVLVQLQVCCPPLHPANLSRGAPLHGVGGRCSALPTLLPSAVVDCSARHHTGRLAQTPSAAGHRPGRVPLHALAPFRPRDEWRAAEHIIAAALLESTSVRNRAFRLSPAPFPELLLSGAIDGVCRAIAAGEGLSCWLGRRTECAG